MGKPGSRSESSTKADSKFKKKLEFYAKVRDTVATLSTQKAIAKKKLRSRQKKLKAYDLSCLSDALPKLNGPQEPTAAAELKLNCQSWKKLILKEGKQLSMVRNHPAFQADPLAAIHRHLQSMQPVMDEKPMKKNKCGSRKRKQLKKSKASAGPQPMDFHLSTLNSGFSSICLDDFVHMSS